MQFNFFPKTIDFDSLFRSQSECLIEAAELLRQLLSEPANVVATCRRIYAIEVEANALSRRIATELASTFITALDREDIHALNSTQEDVMNLIRALTSRFGLYQLGEVRKAARELIDDFCQMVRCSHEMLRLLHAKKTVEAVSRDMLRLKAQTDALLLVALGEIYEGSIDSVSDVVQMVKWSQIYDRIEEAIVRVEQLAVVIEGISLKNA
jgi:uncharacterized protein